MIEGGQGPIVNDEAAPAPTDYAPPVSETKPTKNYPYRKANPNPFIPYRKPSAASPSVEPKEAPTQDTILYDPTPVIEEVEAPSYFKPIPEEAQSYEVYPAIPTSQTNTELPPTPSYFVPSVENREEPEEPQATSYPVQESSQKPGKKAALRYTWRPLKSTSQPAPESPPAPQTYSKPAEPANQYAREQPEPYTPVEDLKPEHKSQPSGTYTQDEPAPSPPQTYTKQEQPSPSYSNTYTKPEEPKPSPPRTYTKPKQPEPSPPKSYTWEKRPPPPPRTYPKQEEKPAPPPPKSYQESEQPAPSPPVTYSRPQKPSPPAPKPSRPYIKQSEPQNTYTVQKQPPAARPPPSYVSYSNSSPSEQVPEKPQEEPKQPKYTPGPVYYKSMKEEEGSKKPVTRPPKRKEKPTPGKVYYKPAPIKKEEAKITYQRPSQSSSKPSSAAESSNTGENAIKPGFGFESGNFEIPDFFRNFLSAPPPWINIKDW